MKHPIHLNALRAFEAAARHQSFSAAAEELSVTPAAIGQLVRGLESWLGVPLFHRNSGGRVRLVATDPALLALPDIRSGFERLSLGLERLKAGYVSGVLTVAVSPAFAAKWLLPRLESFQSQWPDTDVRLDTNLKPVDFIAQRIDIGVRYGLGEWPGLVAVKLMDEEVYPVCAPQWLRARGKLRSPENLANETLIHDMSMEGDARFPSWRAWLANANAGSVQARRGLRINNAAAVLQAAAEGQGVALARSVMARDDVAAGRLIRLFPSIRFASDLAYYVVYRKESENAPRLAAFRDWLQREANAWVTAKTERE